jgi:hypothetical protein
MTCDEAIKLMDVYLDGELDPITSQTIGRTCGIAVTVSKHRDFHAEVRRRTVESTSEILVDA